LEINCNRPEGYDVRTNIDIIYAPECKSASETEENNLILKALGAYSESDLAS